MARLRIFHISDLHARSEKGPQRERAILEAARRHKVLGKRWDQNLSELRKDNSPFDLVVFTGDLGDWGHSTDYDDGVPFLIRTCAGLEVPLNRLFLVPGNHDVNRNIEPTEFEFIRRIAGDSSQGPDQISRWIAGGKPPFALVARNEAKVAHIVDGAVRKAEIEHANGAARTAVLSRTAAFWQATREALGRTDLLPSASPHGRLGYRKSLDLSGLPPIHIIGLDSGWLAGDDKDATRLLITEDQVTRLTTDDAGRPLDGFRLALVHHPLSDIHGADAAVRTIYDNVDLLLRGHQHSILLNAFSDPDRRLHELAAGCLFEGDSGNHHPNGCQVIDIEFGDGHSPPLVHVRFRSWSPKGEFWHDDSSIYANAPGGRLSFTLPSPPIRRARSQGDTDAGVDVPSTTTGKGDKTAGVDTTPPEASSDNTERAPGEGDKTAGVDTTPPEASSDNTERAPGARKHHTSDSDVAGVLRRLRRNYTGAWGAKVFWLAAFTLAPLMIRFRSETLGLVLSIATIVYALYHGVGLYLWLSVRGIDDPAKFNDDERAEEALRLQRVSRWHGPLGLLVLVLIALTFVTKLQVEVGHQRFGVPIPDVVRAVLGVPSPPDHTTEPSVTSTPQEVPRTFVLVLNEDVPHIRQAVSAFTAEVQERMGVWQNFIEVIGSADMNSDALNQAAFADALKRSKKAPDIIVTFGTQVSVYAAKYYSTLPRFFTVVTDPIGSKLIGETEVERRSGNVAGFANGLNRTVMVKALAHCFPGKQFGFLYSEQQRQDIQMLEFLTSQKEIRVKPIKADLRNPTVDASLSEGIDLFFGWNWLNTNIRKYVDSNPYLPFIGPEHANIAAGTIGSYGADFGKLGRVSAEFLVERFFLQGSSLGTLPVQFPDMAHFLISKSQSQHFNLNIGPKCNAKLVP